MTAADLTAHLDTVAVGEPHVEHRDVGGERRNPPESLLRSRSFTHHLEIAVRFEQLAQTTADDLVIVEEEYAGRHPVSLPVPERRNGHRNGCGRRSGAPPAVTIAAVANQTVAVKELRQLLDAIVTVNSESNLPGLLRRILESATSLVNARYGALGVLDPTGSNLSEFLTTGMDDTTVARIGGAPEGLGILGMLVADPRPIRLADLSTHPHRAGFPPHHPPMTTFLGVPIRVRGEVFGNLYLTEKAGGAPFDEIDEELAVGLATTAGVAIENARLHGRVGELRVVEDRERIARDLHDTVIQRLFATGLSLQGAAARTTDAELAPRLEQAVADLDDTVRHIRTTIFELQRRQLPGASLRQELLDVIDEVAEPAQLPRQVSFEGPIDLTVPRSMGDDIAAVVREAVSNVVRHAGAQHVTVRVAVTGTSLQIDVDDDGCGPTTGGDAGLGLENLRARAERRGGTARLEAGNGGGASFTWLVPLPD